METSESDAQAQYRKLVRSAYKLLNGTWGYSPLEYETWRTNDNPPPITPFAQLNPNQQIASLFQDSGYFNALRGYVCFADEMDALQFRLSIDATSRQVHMWPKREFTIHEVVENEP